MTSLFKGKPASEVVPANDVIQVTGTTPQDLGLDNDDELTTVINQWIDETASNIYVRLGRQVAEISPDRAGLIGVLARTVANVVAVSQQQRSMPVIQLGDFATRVLNTGDALDKLDDELQPFLYFVPPGDEDDDNKTGWKVDVFWSSQEYEETP